MNLIENPKKPYLRQIKPGESEYRYLEKATDAHSNSVRDRLNLYFSNIANEKSKAELKTRFKKDFRSAFFELLIHQLFYFNKFKIADHPNIPNSKKKPDYLVSKNNEQIYVECLVFNDLSDNQREIENAKLTFLYKLSTLKSPYYLYNIERLELLTPALPNLVDFFAEIQHILKEKPRTNKDDYSYIHTTKEFKSDSFYVKLNISLKHNWKEGIEEDELLGWYNGNTRYDFSEKSLKRSLSDKMLRYGTTDKPLLVTLNVNSIWFSKKYEFENILYRSGITVIDSKHGNDTRYCENGLFFELKNQLEHLFGVLVVFMGNPYSSFADYYLYKNPFFKGKIQSLGFLENTTYHKSKFNYKKNNNIQSHIE